MAFSLKHPTWRSYALVRTRDKAVLAMHFNREGLEKMRSVFEGLGIRCAVRRRKTGRRADRHIDGRGNRVHMTVPNKSDLQFRGLTKRAKAEGLIP